MSRKAAQVPPNRPAEASLRILLVGTQMALGGAQRLLLDQGRWFAAHGHKVTAAFFYDKQDLADTWQAGLSFPLVTLGRIGSKSGGITRFLGVALGLLNLWRLLQREKFQVVESFTYDSNLLAQPLAWLAGVPARIATHHGIIEGFPRFVERLHTVLINTGIASILVNVSRKVLEQSAAVGIRREHMTVIPNGIPASAARGPDRRATRSELQIGDDEVAVLSVGRLVYQKGHEYLVQAMSQLAGEFPNVKAIICGEGPLREQLEGQIARLLPAGQVELLGNRLDIDRYLRAADVFVLPSRWEGLPVALLEAMDAGLPVVATRVEGVEEVVQDGLNGLLVPPEDARSLADALRSLLMNGELRERISKGARQRVQEAYTIDIMCEKYLLLMQKLQPQGKGAR